MNKRIDILLPDLRGGGVERIRIVLAREFARVGFRVRFVLLRKRGELLRCAEEEFEIIELGVSRTRHVTRALIKYLKSDAPDVIMAAMWPLTIVTPLAARLVRFQGKILISEHNNLSRQYAQHGTLHRLVLRVSTCIGYRLADVRVGVSNGVIADMAKLSLARASKFTLLYNPLVPRERPSDTEIAHAAARWGDDCETRLIAVGSLKAQKNHAMLLRAFSAVKRPKCRLLLLGDGPLRGDLERLAGELGIGDRIVFEGFKEDPTPYYLSADLFVLSSNYEGFGNVIVEALGCGLPIVSTDCESGPSEILEQGRWGKLTGVGDTSEMAKCIEEELNRNIDAAALKQRSRDFSPGTVAFGYLRAVELQ